MSGLKGELTVTESEHWKVEFHCPNPEVMSSHKSEPAAIKAAREFVAVMKNMAETDMAGDSVYQTVSVLCPDGHRHYV